MEKLYVRYFFLHFYDQNHRPFLILSQPCQTRGCFMDYFPMMNLQCGLLFLIHPCNLYICKFLRKLRPCVTSSSELLQNLAVMTVTLLIVFYYSLIIPMQELKPTIPRPAQPRSSLQSTTFNWARFWEPRMSGTGVKLVIFLIPKKFVHGALMFSI